MNTAADLLARRNLNLVGDVVDRVGDVFGSIFIERPSKSKDGHWYHYNGRKREALTRRNLVPYLGNLIKPLDGLTGVARTTADNDNNRFTDSILEYLRGGGDGFSRFLSRGEQEDFNFKKFSADSSSASSPDRDYYSEDLLSWVREFYDPNLDFVRTSDTDPPRDQGGPRPNAGQPIAAVDLFKAGNFGPPELPPVPNQDVAERSPGVVGFISEQSERPIDDEDWHPAEDMEQAPMQMDAGSNFNYEHDVHGEEYEEVMIDAPLGDKPEPKRISRYGYMATSFRQIVGLSGSTDFSSPMPFVHWVSQTGLPYVSVSEESTWPWAANQNEFASEYLFVSNMTDSLAGYYSATRSVEGGFPALGRIPRWVRAGGVSQQLNALLSAVPSQFLTDVPTSVTHLGRLGLAVSGVYLKMNYSFHCAQLFPQVGGADRDGSAVVEAGLTQAFNPTSNLFFLSPVQQALSAGSYVPTVHRVMLVLVPTNIVCTWENLAVNPNDFYSPMALHNIGQFRVLSDVIMTTNANDPVVQETVSVPLKGRKFRFRPIATGQNGFCTGYHITMLYNASIQNVMTSVRVVLTEPVGKQSFVAPYNGFITPRLRWSSVFRFNDN